MDPMADGGRDGPHASFPSSRIIFYEALALIMLGPGVGGGKFITVLMRPIVSCRISGVNVGFHIPFIFSPIF